MFTQLIDSFKTGSHAFKWNVFLSLYRSQGIESGPISQGAHSRTPFPQRGGESPRTTRSFDDFVFIFRSIKNDVATKREPKSEMVVLFFRGDIDEVLVGFELKLTVPSSDVSANTDE